MNKEIIGIEEFVKNNDVFSKKFLVRADFNVPISKGEILEDMRLRAVLPTVDLLTSKGAMVILISHIEADESDLLGEGGMSIVAKYFNEKLNRKVNFVKDAGVVVDDNVSAVVSNMKGGDIILLENLII